MKQTLSRILLVAMLTATTVIFSSTTILAQPATFSGEWKLDEKKSELGEFGGRGTATSIKAEQKENAITITRVTPGFNGGDPMTNTMTVTFDGKEAVSEGFRGSKRKSTAKWSEDGKILTIASVMNFERDGQSMEFKSTENWSITQEGQLSIVTKSNSPRGENTTKAVYIK